MMPRTWIGTGWKMNKTIGEAVAYAQGLREALNGWSSPIEIFIVPPFTAISHVCKILDGFPVWVGAQNMHWEDQGAYTGEISPRMIKDCGASLVELGHSERRAYFGETDETINRKVLAALRWGLRPLICVGETAQDQNMDIAREVVALQVKKALHGVPNSQIDQTILAYEPVWAIGDAGKPATPEYAQQIHFTIRETVRDLYGTQAAKSIPVVYGGSVTFQNAVQLIQQPDLDGLFIGRSGWDVESFIRIIKQVLESRDRNFPSS